MVPENGNIQVIKLHYDVLHQGGLINKEQMSREVFCASRRGKGRNQVKLKLIELLDQDELQQ
jgi:hypothetical protein